MSDEKLSEATKRECAEIIARWLFQQSDSPKLFTLEELLTPLLARLERERDAARSEALEWAADECEGNQRDTGLVKEHCRTWNDAVCRCADEIRKGILAPSVVSQPSREREVLEARWDATRICLQMFDYHGDMAQGRIRNLLIRYEDALAATPASTGGTPR